MSDKPLSGQIAARLGEDRLEVSFRNERLDFDFTAASMEVDDTNGVITGAGKATGDLRGNFAYRIEISESQGLNFQLTEGPGAEVFAFTSSEPVGVLQAPSTTCQCQATVNGTSVFGTRLIVDICPSCELANSVFNLELDFLGRLLIFNATTFTGTTCTETPAGLEVTVQGAGVSNICGPMSFMATFTNGTSISFQLSSPSCFAFEFSDEGPFPTVTRCSAVGVRGLGRTAIQL
jgi:hypothetical protein